MYNIFMEALSEYKELYHYDSRRSLVLNEVTGVVYMMKTLSDYDEAVYEYLASNKEKHIPEINYFTKDGNNNLIVIEEVIQGNTFDVVINNHSMPDKEKLNYFYELLEGLSFLHTAPNPIIHRDLKPSNIMITNKGEVKILDYDAAKIYKPGNTGDTTRLGTEGVAAPEQYGFMQSDPRSDIYAVGKMLAKAFPNNSRIQKIAAKASSFDPINRYSNARESSDALARKISPQLKLKPLFPPPGFRTRKWWKIMLAAMFYPFILFLIIGMNVVDGTLIEQLEYKVFAFIFVFVAVDICNSWTGIYDVLPFVTHDNFFLRFLFKLLFVAGAGIVMMVIFLFVSGLIHLFIA